ncbi:MAG: HDOD domain-containing protein [Gammaproteobacteria bacterium]|nr:HDOD domain-containing protein [Gammaproteobacteria bacterium]
MALAGGNLDERLGALPPLSPVVGELLSLLQAAAVDIGAVERAIHHEPALAGRVLRLANSSFFGFSGRIGTLREACMLLGSRTLRQVVLAAAVMQQMTVDDILLDTRALWRHALVTGAIANRLAGTLGADPEQAFTAGLLHDMGKLVLAAYFAVEYRQVWQHHAANGGLLQEAEQAVLGFDHGAIGERLARKWHFPEELALAVGRHHCPGGDRLGDLIHLANVLAHALGYGATDKIPPLQEAAWERLGLGWERLEQLLPELDREAGEAARFEL